MKALLAASAAVGVAGFLALAPAHASVYDFSFQGIEDPQVHGAGTLTTDSHSPDAVIGATGTIYDPDIAGGAFAITGLSPYAGADNILYARPEPGYWYNSFGGISFATAGGGEFNLGGGGTDAPQYNILNASELDPVGYPQIGYGSDNISLSVVATPELSTWAMLALGFAGLSLAALRNRRRARWPYSLSPSVE